jgi:endonuclease YncB( thermonuclease family)
VTARSLILVLALLFVAAPARAEFVDGSIVLDGREISVSWNDGDSFSFRQGRGRRKRARLVDVNTLENYGPVHRWGDWSAWELFTLSLEPARFAASKAWKCTSAEGSDGYGRLLVRCPDLARELVKQGQAMVFAVDSPASKDLLAAQKDAQKKRAGMWKKGVPPRLITSVHSVLEGKGYNRIVDTKTGRAEAVEHDEAFETCDQVCTGDGKDASCLLFVPFKRRYSDPPPCLTDPRIKPRPPRVVDPRLKAEPGIRPAPTR